MAKQQFFFSTVYTHGGVSLALASVHIRKPAACAWINYGKVDAWLGGLAVDACAAGRACGRTLSHMRMRCVALHPRAPPDLTQLNTEFGSSC